MIAAIGGRTGPATWWLALCLAATAGPVGAVDEDAELAELMSGFDDPVDDARAGAGGTADDALDEVLAGFDADLDSGDDAPAPQAPADPVPADSTSESVAGPWSADHFTGSLGFSGVYAFVDHHSDGGGDWRGVSRLRTRVDLQYEADPLPGWRLRAQGHAWYDWVYDLYDRDYPDKVVDDYRREVDTDELWLRGRLGPHADVKFGRQVVVWGKSDSLRVTDVLNPLDARELGMVDIEDLRLPVTMTRADLYLAGWNLSTLLVHEVRMDKLPPLGSEFYPFGTPLPPNDLPSGTLAHTQLGLALNGRVGRADLSLYAANFYDRQPYLVDLGGPGARRRHARVTMLGAAADLPSGNWLWKAELAHYPGLRLTGIDDRVARTDLLAGVEYAGFTDTSLSLELVDRHYYDYRPLPGGPPRNDWQAALRYQGDFLYDRLHLNLVGTFVELFDNAAGFVRASAEYELTDAIDLRTGVVFYQEGERPPVSLIGDNDRLFLDLEWSF